MSEGIAIIVFCLVVGAAVALALLQYLHAMRQTRPAIDPSLPPERRLELAHIRYDAACIWMRTAGTPSSITHAMREWRAAIGDMQNAKADMVKDK